MIVPVRSLILFCAACAWGQTPPMPGRLVDVGGYRVHVHCTGAGSPTVLILGAGFSFDWALVQPPASKFATVCTYDVSGTAWSDPIPEKAGPELTCRDRVHEAHKLAQAAPLTSPYVLVGLSIGACVARLYAAEYPGEVAGMVIVDHAFSPDRPPPAIIDESRPRLIEQTPIELTVEDISHFERLPIRSQQLHRWAMSLRPKLPTAETLEDCTAQLKTAAPEKFPLGDRPLVVVSTGNEARGYARLQSELLGLSRRSSQMKAEQSFHAVEIDQPDVVVAAIRRVIGLLTQ